MWLAAMRGRGRELPQELLRAMGMSDDGGRWEGDFYVVPRRGSCKMREYQIAITLMILVGGGLIILHAFGIHI
jgi:hypothetical protein